MTALKEGDRVTVTLDGTVEDVGTVSVSVRYDDAFGETETAHYVPAAGVEKIARPVEVGDSPTDAGALDELPDQSVVRDNTADVWTRQSGEWHAPSYMSRLSSVLLGDFGPLTVVHVGDRS
jgi:hypothetical protein